MDEKMFENSDATKVLEEILSRFKFDNLYDLDFYEKELTVIATRKVRLEFHMKNKEEFDKLKQILDILEVEYENY